MWNALAGYSQEATQDTLIKDTLYLNESQLDAPIYYSARDSIYSDVKNKQLHLYGDAKIDNGDIVMNAGYIMVDLNTNEVLARYAYDQDSNKVEFPQFSDGGDDITAHTIRYNFDSKKGYIEEVAIQQDENFLYMKVAKVHPNEQVHFKEGRFTTCSLEDPHYHFQLSKAVMVPDKRIVSGPMNLWISGVPTPIGLPFSIIPQSEGRSKGLLFPQFIPVSQYGFGLQDIGYYLPINDYLQTTFYASIYSRGSWGLRNTTDYAKRYGYKGSLNVGFQQFKSGFPTDTRANKTTLAWNHSKDSKSSPYWGFTARVNYISDNTTQNSLDPLNPEYFSNSFNSDINMSRRFPGKPISAGMKISMRQNSISKNISLTAPILNVNVTRFFPFKNLVSGRKDWHKLLTSFGVSYNFEGQNKSLFEDTLVRDNNYDAIGNKFLNGLNQNMTAQTTASLFGGRFKVTPSLNYGNKINFQQISKSYDAASTDPVLIDTLQLPGMAQTLSLNAQLTTVVYSYYRFVGKRKPLLRHVLTPSIGYRFIPNLNTNKDYINTDTGDTILYSPFERSAYTISSTRNQQLLTFSFSNTFELKTKSEKDTVDGFKRTRIIDALTFSGNYDFSSENKDTVKLSDIAISMRISPLKWLNIVTTSRFSPKGWTDSSGLSIDSYALNSNGRLGRFTTTNVATTLTLTSAESRKKLDEKVTDIGKNWNDDYAYFLLHPEHAINFNIPWKVSLSHVYTLTANQSKSSASLDDWNQIQTLMLNGDVSFTKRWKLASTTNFDLKTLEVTNARFSLTRDMHCWALAFHWTPIGGNKSFLFSIRSTSALFQDAKIDIRKPPAFL
ncbi:MAG: hypothetical protein ACI837_000878 [Crocinitomicaceae bacterium]|jgi:hypothetical protein